MIVRVLPRRNFQWPPQLIHRQLEEVLLSVLYDLEPSCIPSCKTLIILEFVYEQIRTNQLVKIAMTKPPPTRSPFRIFVPRMMNQASKVWTELYTLTAIHMFALLPIRQHSYL